MLTLVELLILNRKKNCRITRPHCRRQSMADHIAHQLGWLSPSAGTSSVNTLNPVSAKKTSVRVGYAWLRLMVTKPRPGSPFRPRSPIHCMYRVIT
jgi:hypothetical protein